MGVDNALFAAGRVVRAVVEERRAICWFFVQCSADGVVLSDVERDVKVGDGFLGVLKGELNGWMGFVQGCEDILHVLRDITMDEYDVIDVSFPECDGIGEKVKDLLFDDTHEEVGIGWGASTPHGSTMYL